MSEVIFVTGIDTDAGKTYATGWLARKIAAEGRSVITQKFIQTGCPDGVSEDIAVHRRIMGTGWLAEDAEGLTAPQVFSYPASPQLASVIDGRAIDFESIDRAADELARRYDVVLVEGAGGPLVPLTDDYLTIDYAVRRRLPVVLVTNGRLGSISHTLLCLEAIKARNLELRAVLYNTFNDTDPLIAADTRGFLRRYLAKHHSMGMDEIPMISDEENLDTQGGAC